MTLTTANARVIILVNVTLIPAATAITADALAIGTIVFATNLASSRGIHVLNVMNAAITGHSRVCVAVFVAFIKALLTLLTDAVFISCVSTSLASAAASI
jgi:hypothetical protein